jgi:hypothetical protein
MIEDNFTLWEPKDDELCVFYDNGTDEYFIARYGSEALVNSYGNIIDDRYFYTKSEFDTVAPLKFVNLLQEVK